MRDKAALEDAFRTIDDLKRAVARLEESIAMQGLARKRGRPRKQQNA
jgi:hypothetical protein